MKKYFFESIYLAMIGDKIGFGNGIVEKNNDVIIFIKENYEKICEALSNLCVFNFISLGGIQGIKINELNISDDTLFHLATIKGMCSNYTNKNELYNNITKEYLEFSKNINDLINVFLAGIQTIEAIKDIDSGNNWRKFKYNKNAGGSGGPMRTMCIGLAFNHSNSLFKLIESSIMITSILHPNCTAFIGSIISALFTSYALAKIEPSLWIFDLVRLLESEIIDDIMSSLKPDYNEYFVEDKKLFLHKLKTFIETSYVDTKYIIYDNTLPRYVYPHIRMLYYYDNYSSNKKILYPGAGADDCVIIAYDCLLMARNNYEHLIYTSMVNVGDSDTIGSIASAWYGAYYGFEGVPKNIILKKSKMYKEIKDLSKLLLKKYNEKIIKEF